AADVLAELIGCQGQHTAVVPAVAGHLVAGRGDGPDKAGVVPGDLADDEEGRPDFGPGQRVEQPAGGLADPLAVVPPQGRGDLQAGGGFDPVVFLDVETQDDLHGSPV